LQAQFVRASICQHDLFQIRPEREWRCGKILKTPVLQADFRAPAESWLRLAQQTFAKWDARGCWREVSAGGLWVVPAFGLDAKTGGWTEGYARRATDRARRCWLVR